MTRVVWANLNPEADARGSWDQGIVEELTAGYEHAGPTFYTSENSIAGVGIENLGIRDEGAVVVIAGQHNRWSKYAEPLAAFVASLPWALTIVTSDEEALFPVELLPHDDRHLIWGQYHARPEFDRVIPIGLPPKTGIIPRGTPDARRDLDVFFAGQNTHARREELIDMMKDMATEPGHGNISWVASTGFRAGLGRDDYLACMARTKIAPCPSGYHSLDSFRLYEAIAAGALPIVELNTPDGPEPFFWLEMFGNDCPLLRVDSWDLLPHLTATQDWQTQRDKVQHWYADYCTSLAADFHATVARLQS